MEVFERISQLTLPEITVRDPYLLCKETDSKGQDPVLKNEPKRKRRKRGERSLKPIGRPRGASKVSFAKACEQMGSTATCTVYRNIKEHLLQQRPPAHELRQASKTLILSLLLSKLQDKTVLVSQAVESVANYTGLSVKEVLMLVEEFQIPI